MIKKKLVFCIVLLIMVQVVCLADIGDVNIDGVADCTDANLIDDYLAGTNYLNDEEAADTNLDGIIDKADSMNLRLCNRLPGDVDGNNAVDTADIFLFMDYLLDNTISIDYINASLNMDNELDFNDLSSLIRIYFSFVQKRWHGDVNGDTIVDHADNLAIREYYVGLNPSPFDPAYADINDDGIINVVDAALIVQLSMQDFYLGDVDNDYDVDSDDLKDLINEFDQHSMIEFNPAKDTNEDGAVTYADLTALALLVFRKTGDVNYDYSVDIVDALLVAQYYVGLIPFLPVIP